MEKTTETGRTEKISSVLVRISNAVSTTRNLKDLFRHIHEILKDLVDARNFFVALMEKEKDRIVFPYYADEKDHIEGIHNISHPDTPSLTIHVIRTGRPLFKTKKEILAEGLKYVGTMPEVWIGIPLKVKEKVIGAMAVQHYSNPHQYTLEDMDLMVSASEQVALAIERKMNEEALIRSEERYRSILDIIENGYYEVDIAGNFIFVNDSVCKILGYSKEELIGMNNRAYMDKEDAAVVYRMFNQVYETGKPDRGFDWEVVRKGGQRRYVETAVSLMQDEDGNKVGFRGILRDITERKNIEEELLKHRDHLEELIQDRTSELTRSNIQLRQEISERKRAEEALHESKEDFRKLYDKSKKREELYRSLLQSSADAIVIYDMEGKTRYVSPSFTEIFGWDLEEVKGKPMPFLPEFEKKTTMAIIKNLVEHGKPLRGYQTKRLTKDGRLLNVSISTSRYDDHEGNPAGILATIRDITETKKLEAQLQHAQKMESIGTMASGVAHNFRNILAGVSVNSQLLKVKHKEDLELQELSERITSYVSRGSQLVEGLMQFSRKQIKQELDEIDMKTVIQDTFELIRESFDKLIDIQLDLPESLLILGDDSAMRQVMMNLCTNARDAMPTGGLLKISGRRRSDQVSIEISDTGQGMDDETLKNCFDPFYTTKDVDKGTGLGLSTTYGIIKDHGGDIQVMSDIDQGTTFVLTLPLHTATQRHGSTGPYHVVPAEGLKILVVDDEKEMLRTMKDLLNGMGYLAITVSTGKEAVERYKSWKPDAVLLDRNMPEMDGITCLNQIMETDPDARIILISGYDEEGPHGIDMDTREAIVGYLTKPIDIGELNRVLGRL